MKLPEILFRIWTLPLHISFSFLAFSYFGLISNALLAQDKLSLIFPKLNRTNPLLYHA